MNSEEQDVVTLNEICRACLVKTDNMKQLSASSEETAEIVKKLASVSNVEIELTETLPSFLCRSCEEKLYMSYDFQQLCQKSHHFLLDCLSASSVSFKVNTFKPLSLDNTSKECEVQPLLQADSNSDAFISFVDNDGLTKTVPVSYCAVPEITELNEADGVNLELVQEDDLENNAEMRENTSDDEVNDSNNVEESEDGYENITSESVEDEISDVKPSPVDRRTRFRQTMRLSQFSPEDVEQAIKKFKQRFFKNVDCLHCEFIAKDCRALSTHMTRLHKELKQFWCMWCNNNYENLDEHIKTIHNEDFKCPFCGISKMATGHFMEHLYSHSTERSFICSRCGKNFISRRHLRVHYKIHRKKPFECRICSKNCISQELLIEHYKTHYTRWCDICEKKFTSSVEFIAHKCFANEECEETIKMEEDLDLNHEWVEMPQNYCRLCKKRVRSLMDHNAAMHVKSQNEDKPEVRALCSYCGKQFDAVSKLTIHQRTHTKETPYKCSYCGKRMRTRIHLVVHQRIHTGEKPHVCKFCGKAFAQSGVLNTHLKIHTGKTEECFLCQKRFCRPSELRNHMKTHTGEKPYRCQICNQAFAQKNYLNDHSFTHCDERPHKCKFCDKSFKLYATLRGHLNTHAVEKPYKCTKCGYTCRQRYHLKTHMWTHETKQDTYKCGLCNEYFKDYDFYLLHHNKEHAFTESSGDVKEDLIEVSAAEVIKNLEEFV